MHICLMTRTTLEHGGAGGMERHSADLSHGLAERGHRITVITTCHPEGTLETRTDGIRTIFLADAPSGRYSAAWWRESENALSRLHTEDPVDLIWGESIGAYGVLRPPRKLPSIPCVAILHGTPVGEWRGKRRQWGTSARHLPQLARFGVRTVWQHRMFCTVVRQADGLICVSRELANEAAREFHLRAEKIDVVPNGVDAAQFSPSAESAHALRASLGVPDDVFVLLTVGRLERAKGHHLALEVLARLLEQRFPAVLLVAGAGPDEGWLRAQAQALGLDECVSWLGAVPHDQMPAVYDAADVVLLLSLHSEAFPYALIEAMACGRAVVSSLVGGVPSAIAHDRTGVLVPPNDAGRAAAETARLLHEPERRLAMGKAARQAALALFTLDRMVAATEAVFLRCARASTAEVRL